MAGAPCSSLARHSERRASGGLASFTPRRDGGNRVGPRPGDALEKHAILGESLLQTQYLSVCLNDVVAEKAVESSPVVVGSTGEAGWAIDQGVLQVSFPEAEEALGVEVA